MISWQLPTDSVKYFIESDTKAPFNFSIVAEIPDLVVVALVVVQLVVVIVVRYYSSKITRFSCKAQLVVETVVVVVKQADVCEDPTKGLKLV